ncbi:MAG: DUF3261 domain-containing protein [Sandaracinus sp.]|nr:DUF3261 domain-containing protein [Myxococcales bacterium]MCB9615347.1 DUF3261 domain-containing protein [Sandaracinus sp.]
MKRAIVLGLLVVAACGPRGGGGPPVAGEGPGYPTRMVEPSAIEGDFLVEQEVRMTHPRGENTFRAVLQKRGGELILLGLAPHGGRAFLLKQDATGTSFESFMPFELPFPPEYILHDVHRTWFLGVAGEGSEVSVERDGERVVERRDASGAVLERSFERLDGQPDGVLTVRFGAGLAPGAPMRAAPPDEVHFDNAWYGYRARIRTLRWQPL